MSLSAFVINVSLCNDVRRGKKHRSCTIIYRMLYNLWALMEGMLSILVYDNNLKNIHLSIILSGAHKLCEGL